WGAAEAVCACESGPVGSVPDDVVVVPLPFACPFAVRWSGKNTSTGRLVGAVGALGMRAPSPRPSARRFSLMVLVPLSVLRRGRVSGQGGAFHRDGGRRAGGGAPVGELGGSGEVGQRPARVRVVGHHGLTVAGRLGDAHGSRHRATQHLVGEVTT